MSFLKLNNVSVKYGTGSSAVFALKDINMMIDKGDIIAIIEPSGAEKSTLLSVLGGIEKPTKGFMEYDGNSCSMLLYDSY
ncbi:ATP-binding cassette domain-containing protein [Eubacterium sp.]|uniref:ATP-binding cassette domain-containing protein n=1 Tax=Eubacterium sp. TaxID=142586 RepID=UPI0025DC7A1E|nr:ATP-binding cassette domain-containing protein [Eubacterium sp.]MCR5629627.1 ATP-binding cassette domain-containing protein [Eubacterium sp.]